MAVRMKPKKQKTKKDCMREKELEALHFGSLAAMDAGGIQSVKTCLRAWMGSIEWPWHVVMLGSIRCGHTHGGPGREIFGVLVRGAC